MALDMRCKTECMEREEIILSESHLGKCYTYLRGLIDSKNDEMLAKDSKNMRIIKNLFFVKIRLIQN